MDPIRSRFPRYMSDPERLQFARDLMEEAYSALCWIGCGDARSVDVDRPELVEKALRKLDKTLTSLEPVSL